MAIKLEMLRCFCAVAEAGTLSEAARRLGRTQSALSMTLKQLEDHLGRSLFEGERKNRLSPLGQEVYEMALRQLQQFDDTLSAIETSARSPRGLLRIYSVPSVAALVFPSTLAEMQRRHPGLATELRDTDSAEVFRALLHSKADIGIASGQTGAGGVRRIALFEDGFGLVASPDHPLITRRAGANHR